MTPRAGRRVPDRIRALAVLHPFPSALNALAVVALAAIAGGDASRAVVLGVGMLSIQFAIGTVNDLFDEDVDARAKPWKPIPSRLLTRRTVGAIAVGSGLFGLALAASAGPVALGLAAGMLAAGLVYDALLKRTAFGWVAYAVAFPLLPLYAWSGAAAGLPPRPELLLPVAALAGPTLALANGLVDLERDRATGVRGPAVVLGRGRTVGTLAALHALLFTIAWTSLLLVPAAPAEAGSVPGTPLAAAAVVLAATLLAATGVIWSADARPARRERGWEAQTIAVALLAGGWLLAALDGSR